MNTIYYNGTILTMNPHNEKATAVYIKDGKIIKVGDDSSILSLQQDGTQIIDLQGKAMMPGFIDPHSHFIGVANSLSQCDLSEAISFEDIINKMKAFIKENPVKDGEWIFGTNYDHNFLKEKRHPDKFVLDQISKDLPIVVIHASGHMGIANSKALELQLITDHTKDPVGGKYNRFEGTNEPNGYMEENAFTEFRNNTPMTDIGTLLKLVLKAQDIYASYGITTVQDGMVTPPLFQLLKYVAESDMLQLDVVGFVDLDHSHDLMRENEYVNQYHHRLKLGGYKVFLDGSPQGRTAWMSTPYQNAEDGYSGYPTLKDEHLYTLIETALSEDQQLLAHCNGDAASQQYIDQFEKVLQKHPNWEPHRPVMIHAQLVRKDQLERMKKIDMMPSFFVAHTYYWGDIHIENFGKERADHISPAKDALDLGIPFTFHQDSPVLSPDMMKTVWCAVNRQTKNGQSIGDCEKIDIYSALKAITINGAYQYFEEDQKGSIEEGKLADLVILDRNPLETDPKDLADITVLETIKEGKTIFKREK